MRASALPSIRRRQSARVCSVTSSPQCAKKSKRFSMPVHGQSVPYRKPPSTFFICYIRQGNPMQFLCKAASSGIGMARPIVKGINANLPDNHFIITCMDGAAERGYMSASRFIHSSRAVPDTVPVLHPPARRADRLRNGSCRPKRQDRPLPGTR